MRALTIKIIAILLGGCFLATQCAFAQSRHDATALTQQFLEYYKQGRYSKAIPFAEQALAIEEETRGPRDLHVATALYNLANVYTKLGRYSDAEPLFKRSLAIREQTLGLDHPDAAYALTNLALLYNEQGRFAEAKTLYKRSLAILETAFGPDHPDVAQSLNNLARLYHAQGLYAEAEPLLKRSLAIREQTLGPDDPNVAGPLSDLAILYVDQGRYFDSEALIKRSLAILEKAYGPEHPAVAQSLSYLASVYGTQRRDAEAESLYRRSLLIYEKALGPDHPSAASTLIGLAILYHTRNRHADAESLYRRSLEISEKALGPDNPAVAVALNNLATLYKDDGHYADAEALFKRSLAIQEKIHGLNHPAVADSLNNLAVLYNVEARYAEANQLYRRALEIEERTLGSDHPYLATTLDGLATWYDVQGRFDDAEPLYRRSLAIYEKALGPDHPYLARSLKNLATLYKDHGHYADAEKLYKRSLAIQEKVEGPDHPNFAYLLSSLASVYYSQGRYTDAELLYNSALRVQKKLGDDSPALADSLTALADIYQAQQRYADAEVLYKQSLTIEEKAFGSAHPMIAVSLNNLAKLYVRQGRYADALPLVRTASQMGFTRKSTFMSALSGAVKKLSLPEDIAFNEGYQIVQQTTSTAVAKAVNQLAVRFAVGNDQLAELVRRDQDLFLENERLDKLIVEAASKESFTRDIGKEQQIKARIGAIANERTQIATTLNRRFPAYAAFAKPPLLSVQETQQLLADDEALIVYDFDEQGYAEVFTRTDARSIELSITAEDLNTKINVLRSSLASGGAFDVDASYRLYQLIFGPFADFISSKKRFSVVMNGALTSFPLQLLVTNDPTGKNLKDINWLVRKYAITVLPSTASLRILREEKLIPTTLKPMIGFADPVFHRTVGVAIDQKLVDLNRSLPEFYRGVTIDTVSLAEALEQLPETANEVRTVARELGAGPEDLKLGDAASVTTLKHLPLDKYRVVYFATHALVAGEVEKFSRAKAEPALVLSIPDKPTEEDDGLLRASDVAMLKLNADFVVLSACNTAAGDKPGAEALSGLAQAFFYAGARSLIVSNWAVDSDSTVALMTGLFEALKSDPHLSHAEALRLSVLRMIANPTNPDWVQPRFWAPFIIVGEPKKV